ncbi:hypothetical protein CB1_000521001 [Camelus ferus]|nr:hypothetical protein CB1_000521001 [Camelus ferus]
MDVLVCNGLGIYCGMKTLEWLSLKTYKWQGLWNIPTYNQPASLVRTRPWHPLSGSARAAASRCPCGPHDSPGSPCKG